MSKSRNSDRLLAELQQEKNNDDGLIITSKEENNNNLIMDQEIECPRCHNIMTLYSSTSTSCVMCVKNAVSSSL